MPSDVYVRLTAQGPRTFGATVPYRSIVFVDLHEDEVDKLRETPQGIINRPAAVIVRCEAPPRPCADGEACPEHRPRLAAAVKAKERLALDCPIGLLCQPVGGRPELEFDKDPKEGEGELLRRARAVELEALLEWGEAVWRPDDYHYRLPSGQHTGVFIRMADAIREPRDAHVLATWLRPRLTDGLAVICDSGTISAVVESLKASASAARIEPGRTAVLEQYPASPLDVSQAIQHVLRNPEGAMLGLLSVNSSGQVAGWLWRAMKEAAGGIRRWSLEIMVDRQPRDMPSVTAWLPIPGGEPLLEERRQADAGACPMCASAKRERLIPINPRSFDGMMPGQVRQLMPVIGDPKRNASYWERCSKAGAIGLLEKPDEAVHDFRPSPEKMPIRFRHDRLLADPAYREAATRLVAELVAEHAKKAAREDEEREEEIKPRERRWLSGEADLVLVPEHEAALDGYDDLWAELGPVIAGAGVRYEPFPVKGDWSEELAAKVDAAGDMVVFALGLVTGGSLNRALVRIQVRREDREFAVRALVMHARPEREREWESLENSFDKRLFPVWHTLVRNRELLAEEAAAIEDLNLTDLSPAAQEFLGERQTFCSGGVPEQDGMFWGARSSRKVRDPDSGEERWEKGDTLSPHSLFGEDLNGIATLMAVGAAMERARQRAQEHSAPEMRVFELDALTSSYFDPMILAAAFRWLRPQEAWWGEKPEEAETVMNRMVEWRTEEEHLRVLVPELLLATAQGKVTPGAATIVERKADALLQSNAFGEPERAALELGLRAAQTRKLRLADGP